jgi:hypothetical protein
MNLLLFLILLITGEAAYYEYTTEQRTTAGFVSQLAEQQTKMDALQAHNTELKDEKKQLGTTISQAQAIAAQQEKQAAQNEANPGSPGAPASVQSSGPSTFLNINIGTITTLLGKTYENCKLLKVQPDGVVISHSQGIVKVPFSYMTPDLQKRFGYDPNKAAAENEANLKYQEQMRAAAAAQNDGGSAPANPPSQ